MIFKYKVTTPQGEIQTGTIDASSSDIALSSLQRRNLIVMSLSPIKKDSGFLSGNFSLFNGIKTHDMVVVSRQLSTLFQAVQVRFYKDYLSSYSIYFITIFFFN